MVNPVNGFNAQSVALKGVNRSQQEFADAAVDVVNGFAEAANNIQSAAPGGTGLSTSTVQAAQQADPASDLVRMTAAENAFKANIKVLEVQDQMQDDLQGVMKKRLDTTT